jgi:hypothetical protein
MSITIIKSLCSIFYIKPTFSIPVWSANCLTMRTRTSITVMAAASVELVGETSFSIASAATCAFPTNFKISTRFVAFTMQLLLDFNQQLKFCCSVWRMCREPTARFAWRTFTPRGFPVIFRSADTWCTELALKISFTRDTTLAPLASSPCWI